MLALWRVRALRLPCVRRPCPRCDGPADFNCSERFRVNANGGRLDVWLIYLCVACGYRWNHRVHRRVLPADIDVVGFETNDPALVRTHAIAGPAPFSVLGDPAEGIEFAVDPLLVVRLDRVLAQGLAISRSTVGRLGVSRKDLARPVRSGQVVRFRSRLSMGVG